eukprot:2898724-Pyramimonas_sp.AAC.1
MTALPASGWSQAKAAVWDANLIAEDGTISLFKLMGPLEVLVLPTDLDAMKMMRTLSNVTMALADNVQLKLAFCALYVGVPQIQGHCAPGQPKELIGRLYLPIE